MENILQVWLYFTYKQTQENRKKFSKKYFTSKQTVCVVVLHAQHFDNKT